jgi:hypothetical protein
MEKIRREGKRLGRKRRVRKKVRGTSERPRLSVFRTSKHIYVQIIDDDNARTLVGISSLKQDIRDKLHNQVRKKKGLKRSFLTETVFYIMVGLKFSRSRRGSMVWSFKPRTSAAPEIAVSPLWRTGFNNS